jgi:hypothetical protein
MDIGRESTGFKALNEPVEPKRTVKEYGSLKRAFSQGTGKNDGYE